MLVIRNHPEGWKLWKNGGGLTRELAIAPPGAGVDDFSWRVSIAKIERPGPFSSFPGAQRQLMLLQGNGAMFRFTDRVQPVTEKYQRLVFAGDEDLFCTTIHGPCLVMNVMTRNGWRCDLEVDHGQTVNSAGGAERLVLVTGGVYRGNGPDGIPRTLYYGDAAQTPDHTTWTRESGEGASAMVVLTFRAPDATVDSPHALH